MTLDKIDLNKSAKVITISDKSLIKRRLLDIGLTPGTKIECVLENPGKNLIAYMIRGSLIAIRDEDIENILIEAMWWDYLVIKKRLITMNLVK